MTTQPDLYHCTVPDCPWTYTLSEGETVDVVREAWQLHYDTAHVDRNESQS